MKHILLIIFLFTISINLFAQLNIDSILVVSTNDNICIGFKPGSGDSDTTFALSIVGDSIAYDTITKRISIVDTAFVISKIDTDTLARIYTDTNLLIATLINQGWDCADSSFMGNKILFNGNTLFINKIKLFSHNQDSNKTDSSGYAMHGKFHFSELSWGFKLDSASWCYYSNTESTVSPSIHTVLNDTLSVAGVSLILLNTTLDYNTQSGTFVMYGDTISFLYSDDTLNVGFGDVNNPGLEYRNDIVEQLLCIITDSIDMHGVSLIVDSLFIEYNGDSSTFSFYCDSLDIGYQHKDSTNNTSNHELKAHFGSAQNPGLLIQNGQLIHFTFGLSDSIRLMGLNIDLGNINLEYDASLHLYEMYGGPMTVIVKNDTIGIDFGNEQYPGLLIENGVLEDISIGITGQGTLLGFEFASDSLHLNWIVDSAYFGISSGNISLFVDTSAINKDSITIEFIPPGLKIKGSEIIEFNGRISENFTLKGLSFKTDELMVNYDHSQDKIRVFDGDIIIKYDQDSLDVQCGSNDNPGLSLHDGKIMEVDISIGSEIMIKSFECRTYNLNLEYIDTSDIFGISGDSIFLKFANDSLLGENIGIEFRDGSLDKFKMGINKDFKMKALEIHPKSLTFAYNRDSTRFELYDSVLIKIDSNDIDCDFGDQNNPGIIFQNGDLVSININVSSDLKIGGMEFIIKDAGIQWPMHQKNYSTYYDSNLKLQTTYYTSTHDTLALFGDFQIKELWKADIKIGTSEQPGIEIYKNSQDKSKFKIDNLSLKLEEVKLDVMTLEKLLIRYNSSNVLVECDAIIGNSFEAYGMIDMADENGTLKLDSFMLGFDILPSKEGIPIGDIGVFLQGADAGYDFVHNKFRGGFQLSDGVAYRHGSSNGFMMYFDGQCTITKNYFHANMSTKIGGYYQPPNWHSDIGEADFYTKLDWKNKTYSLDGEIKIPTDYGVKINSIIKLKKNVSVFYGDVDVRIPHEIPIIGGKHLGNVGGALMMYHKHRKSSFAAGWTHFKFGCVSCHHWWCDGNWTHCLMNCNAGIEYKFYNQKFYKIGSSSIKHIKKDVHNAKSATKKVYAFEVEISNDAFGDILHTKIELSDYISIDSIDILVLGPNGISKPTINLFDSLQGFYVYNKEVDAAVSTNEVYLLISENINTSSFFSSFKNSDNAQPKVVELERGMYEIVVKTPSGISAIIETEISHSNAILDLELNSTGTNNQIELKTYSWIPQVNVEPKFDSASNTVTMTTHDVNNSQYSSNVSEIRIYVDNDSLDYDGELIDTIHNIVNNRNNGVQIHKTLWSPHGHKPGEKYYFYALLRDSLNAPLYTEYLPGITVNPNIIGSINNIDTAFKAVEGIIVFLDLNNNGKLDLNRIVDYKDSLSANDSIPFKNYNAEPSCVTDSLGQFYFDVHRHSNTLLDTGLYRIEFYLPSDYNTDSTSPFKRGDLFHYDGSPYNINIYIKEENPLLIF
ncbi:MAG: hypothetical protein KAG84_03160 [Bacteroidales bacterium]|nr:hypothetical protein [Bacteroidales bacterium]